MGFLQEILFDCYAAAQNCLTGSSWTGFLYRSTYFRVGKGFATVDLWMAVIMRNWNRNFFRCYIAPFDAMLENTWPSAREPVITVDFHLSAEEKELYDVTNDFLRRDPLYSIPNAESWADYSCYSKVACSFQLCFDRDL